MLSHILNGLLLLSPVRVIPILNALLSLLPNLDKICKLFLRETNTDDCERGEYHKVPKFWDSRKLCRNLPKIQRNTEKNGCERLRNSAEKFLLFLAVSLQNRQVRPEFFYFLFYRFFSQQVRVGGQNKNKNKIHSEHFPIELKLKETRNRVSFNFKSIGKWSE